MTLTGTQLLDAYTHANRLSMNLARRIDSALANATAMDGQPLSRGDAEVLRVIADLASDARPTAVAYALDRSTPTIAHVLTRLEARALIARDRHPEDGRVRVLTLTDAGRLALSVITNALTPAVPRRGVGPQVLTKVRAAANAAR